LTSTSYFCDFNPRLAGLFPPFTKPACFKCDTFVISSLRSIPLRELCCRFSRGILTHQVSLSLHLLFIDFWFFFCFGWLLSRFLESAMILGFRFFLPPFQTQTYLNSFLLPQFLCVFRPSLFSLSSSLIFAFFRRAFWFPLCFFLLSFFFFFYPFPHDRSFVGTNPFDNLSPFSQRPFFFAKVKLKRLSLVIWLPLLAPPRRIAELSPSSAAPLLPDRTRPPQRLLRLFLIHGPPSYL